MSSLCAKMGMNAELIFTEIKVSLQDSNTEAKGNSAMADCIPYFELAGHESEPETDNQTLTLHLQL